MAWFGIATIVALLLTCGAQLYARDSDGRAKRAACAETSGGLTDLAAAPSAHHPERSDHAGERRARQHDADHEKRLVATMAACTASAELGDDRSSAIAIFLRTLGPFVGVMAFFLGGLRYDASRRASFGGRAPHLEFGATRGRVPIVWTIRSEGDGSTLIEGVRVLDFPLDRSVGDALHSFELFQEAWQLEPGETRAFESSKKGEDILVAALVRRADSRREVIWARLRVVDERQGYEQREEGRFLRS